MPANDYGELFSLLDAKDFTAAYDELTQRKPAYKDVYQRLSAAYKRDRAVRAVLDHFATLGESSYSIDVTPLETEVRFTDKPRGEIIRVLKEVLAASHWGDFVNGRRGRDSRFESINSLKKMGQLASYQPTVGIVPIQDEDMQSHLKSNQIPNGVLPSSNATVSPSATGQILKHRFLLRPDYAINIDLPCNLTNAEANRFAEFIKSLPFT